VISVRVTAQNLSDFFTGFHEPVKTLPAGEEFVQAKTQLVAAYKVAYEFGLDFKRSRTYLHCMPSQVSSFLKYLEDEREFLDDGNEACVDEDTVKLQFDVHKLQAHLKCLQDDCMELFTDKATLGKELTNVLEGQAQCMLDLEKAENDFRAIQLVQSELEGQRDQYEELLGKVEGLNKGDAQSFDTLRATLEKQLDMYNKIASDGPDEYDDACWTDGWYFKYGIEKNYTRYESALKETAKLKEELKATLQKKQDRAEQLAQWTSEAKGKMSKAKKDIENAAAELRSQAKVIETVQQLQDRLGSRQLGEIRRVCNGLQTMIQATSAMGSNQNDHANSVEGLVVELLPLLNRVLKAKKLDKQIFAVKKIKEKLGQDSHSQAFKWLRLSAPRYVPIASQQIQDAKSGGC